MVDRAGGAVEPPDDFEVRVGDALEELEKIPDECVQTCVTSPPYWGLRDYGVEGQLGLEPTPEAYVENLVDVFREVRRGLRPDGTLWLNLGDSYAGSGPNRQGDEVGADGKQNGAGRDTRGGVGQVKPKDMVGIPWRVAFALQADGWWLRSDIIWRKPNPMPESVTDRPTSSHEHIFLLAKSGRYYYDHEAIKEGASGRDPGNKDHQHRREGTGKVLGRNEEPNSGLVGVGPKASRNKRDVWTVTTKPYPDAHFAVYPPELIVPCVKAGTSQRGQCVECGEPWEREVERESPPDKLRNRGDETKMSYHPRQTGSGQKLQDWYDDHPPETVGWTPTCDCDADTEPQLVLDPFAGAGTTGVVCTELGRRFLGIELNPEYAEMARKRIMDTNPTLFRGTA